MTDDSSPATGEQPLPDPPKALNWIVCLAGLGCVLAFFWGQVPVSTKSGLTIKAPGLSTAVLGAAFGWVVGSLSREFRIRASRLVGTASAIAAISGLAGSAVVAHRAGVAEMDAYDRKHPPQIDPIKAHIEQALSQPDSELSDEERANLKQARSHFEQTENRRQEREAFDRERRTFLGYLNNRIPKKWGTWLPPWPTVFWVAELLLAGGLSGWLAVRQSLGNRAAA